MRFISFVPALIAVSAGCDTGDPSSAAALLAAAKRCDFIVLADTDTNSGTVLHRYTHLVSSRADVPFLLTSNSVLRASGPRVESGHAYGEQALVFMTVREKRLHVDTLAAVHNGRVGGRDGQSLETVLSKVKTAYEDGHRNK